MGGREGSVGGALGLVAALAAVLLAGSATSVEGQLRGGGPPDDEVGRSLELGVRAGIDYQGDSPILGGQLRLSVDPWRRVDLLPSVEFVFQNALTERQVNLDGAFYVDDGRTLYLGGGAAYRNTYYLDEDNRPLPTRETRTGYNVFGGIHLSSTEFPLRLQVEGRWTFIDDFEPRTIELGLNYPIPLGF